MALCTFVVALLLPWSGIAAAAPTKPQKAVAAPSPQRAAAPSGHKPATAKPQTSTKPVPAASPKRHASPSDPAAGRKTRRQLSETCIELDMPPRLQWPDYNGYCGETSVQMSALYYGAWISQYAARAAGGGTQKDGQLLLPFNITDPTFYIGTNLAMGAAALKLDYDWFPSPKEGKSQVKPFLEWTKQHLIAGHPVIMGAYIQDCGGEDDCWDVYDHIMPITGFCTFNDANDTTYYPDDSLEICGLFSKTPAWREFSTMAGNPGWPVSDTSCQFMSIEGGCLPEGTNYGVAITGIRDDDNTCLPARLAVNGRKEPNIAAGKRPGWLKGTVTVSGLTSGRSYSLLRYDDAKKVPTSGDAAAFLKSSYVSAVNFTADDTEWVHKDLQKIKTDGVTYYRCVALP